MQARMVEGRGPARARTRLCARASEAWSAIIQRKPKPLFAGRSYMMCAAYIQIHAQTSALRVLRTPSCLDTVLLLYSALTTMLMLHMVVGAFGLVVTTHDDTRR